MFPKKINDIKIKSGHIICERFLNMNELEFYILKLEYTGTKKIKDDSFKNFKFPPFIVSFFHFIYSYLRIPTEKEFVENYYKLNNINPINDQIIIGDSRF